MSRITKEIQQIIAEDFPELVAEAQADLKPCPADIADVVLRILQTGIVEARSAGWSGDAKMCTDQANHLHNLPDLLCRYSPRKLNYYWNLERAAYINRMGGSRGSLKSYGPNLKLWAELEPMVPQQ